MKKPLTMRDELIAAVDDVKKLTPRAIADMLARRKILGRPGTTGRCPLALLMTGARGGKFIVGQKYVMRQSGKSVEKIKTPENLASFVRQFDSGRYPELIQVPPRCLPARDRPKETHERSGPSGKHHKYKRGAERLHLAKDVQRFKIHA